jgi:hypothetical protein
MGQFRLQIITQEFLKIYVYICLQIVFAVKTRIAEGQWLEEQMNMMTSTMF